jgi:predicted ArsR family transcriptional regulator
MSASEATRLINDLHTNTSLLQQINTASQSIVTVANNLGYSVTAEEISDALRQHWQVTDVDCPYHPLSEAPGL